MDLPPSYMEATSPKNSRSPSPYPQPIYKVICIGLTRSNRIQLIGFRDIDLYYKLLNILTICGRAPELVETKEDFCTELKLGGCPWWGYGNELFGSRRILVNLLTCMAQNGWNLLNSMETSKHASNKAALYFEPGPIDLETKMFAVTFTPYNRIRVIDSEEMYGVLKRVLVKKWDQGIVGEKTYPGLGSGHVNEIKLWGNPFYEDGKTARTKYLLGQIIQAFHGHGYKLYASVDLCKGSRNEDFDLETWVFRKMGAFYN